MREINFSDGFSYGRSFSIKRILDADTVFGNTDILEFLDFNEFLPAYCLPELNLQSIKGLKHIVVPINSRRELESLYSIENIRGPEIILYLKIIDEDVLSSFRGKLENTRIMVDEGRSAEFLGVFRNLEDKTGIIEYMRRSAGIIRTKVDYENRFGIIEKMTKDFSTFPFFCETMPDWDFLSFENMTMKEMEPVVYSMKFIRTNLLSPVRKKEICWSDFGDFEGKSEYRYRFYSKQADNHLYMHNGELSFSEGIGKLPSFPLDMIGKDANDINRKEIDPFIGILSVKFHNDDSRFIDKEQNMRCTGSAGSLPYLNRIVNRIITEGDI